MSKKLEPNPSPRESAPIHVKQSKAGNARLERKRELDRVAQRTSREKTRRYISRLEDLVQALQSGNHPDAKVEKLVAQLNKKSTEASRLRDVLEKVQRIANEACTPSTTNDAMSDTYEEQEEPKEVSPYTPASEEGHNETFGQAASSSGVSEMASAADEYAIKHLSYLPIQLYDGDARNCSPTLLSTTLLSQRVSTGSLDRALTTGSPATLGPKRNDTLSVSQVASSIAANNKLEGRLWYLAGTLLSHVLKHPQQHSYSTVFDEDIAIRAVVEGWSATMEQYPLDRGWQWLKELDETIYFDSGIPERLMHLRNCRLQFLAQVFPEAKQSHLLPDFFAARPFQRFLDHDPLIEHFPWPTFRERLLLFPSKYATNRFMDALRKNIHFVWNHDLSDLYVKDIYTGMYSYSQTFLTHSMDIRCYSAKPEMFGTFPELREDIPYMNLSPMNDLITCFSTTGAYIDAASNSCIRNADKTDEENEGSVLVV